MSGTVRDIMSTPPLVVRPQDRLAEAARLMRDYDVGDVIVSDDGTLAGILTDRDIVVRGFATDQDPREVLVSEVCTREVTSVAAGDDADRVVGAMRDQAVRRVPVTDDGQVVGVLSIGDLALERDPGSALADISAARPNQ